MATATFTLEKNEKWVLLFLAILVFGSAIYSFATFGMCPNPTSNTINCLAASAFIGGMSFVIIIICLAAFAMGHGIGAGGTAKTV